MDIDPEKRSGLLEQAALGGSENINGLELRPMTLGTWSLHRRIKASANETYGEDWTFDLMAFVFLHNAPEQKLRASFGRPEALVPEIFDFMQTRHPSDVAAFQPWVKSQMDQFSASLTASDPVAGAIVNDPKS